MRFQMFNSQLDNRSIELRRAILEVLRSSRRGHVGSALSLVEILRVLYDDILRYDIRRPKWTERDRCILSKGHGCLALYVLLAEKGFFGHQELAKFCTLDGMLGGHPEHQKIPGVEATTGSLGHGLSIGVGMALAARQAKAKWRVFVVLGDGECNEGSIWEAAMCGGKHHLDNLVALVDCNKMQSAGLTADIQDMEPFAAKWESFGFATREVDGHDVAALKDLLVTVPFEPDRPSAVICHTVKGKGLASAENSAQWHHKSRLEDEDIDALLAELEG